MDQLNLYHAEIYFFPISCATELIFFKKSLFYHFSGFKKHYVAFSKELILALGERYKSVYRRNISIGIPLDLSIPTEMTSIEPLVENEISSKTPKKLKIMLCHIFLTDRT